VARKTGTCTAQPGFSRAESGYPDPERLMARLGGSGSSWPRISNSSQFQNLQPEALWLHHLNPTNGRMTKTTTTMLAVINIATVVPLPDSPSFVVEGLVGRRPPMLELAAWPRAWSERLAFRTHRSWSRSSNSAGGSKQRTIRK
jgi:hypothetical protein